MSGGSYNYAYRKVNEMAESLNTTTPLRKAFKSHLIKVAQAMQDIEWVDSCDYVDGDEDEAIRTVLGVDADKLALKEVVEDAKAVIGELTTLIDACEK